MPIKVEFGGVNLTGDTQSEPSDVRRPESGSVRIGVIGDFRGRGTRGPIEPGRALAGRRCVAIDRDNFDSVMARLGVELTLTLPAAGPTPVALNFRELDDFHPDRILAKAEVFAALRATRDRLQDPATFADEAARIAKPVELSPPTPPTPGADLAPEALLDLILQQSTHSTQSARTASPEGRAFGSFLDQITAPHALRDDPRQAELIAGVEATMADVLREVLHHPEFQALESLWRGAHLLVRRLETGPDLTIELIDLTRAELEGDLLTAAPLETTAAFKRLVEPRVGTEGGRPWTFLVGDFTFGPSRRDVALLWRLGQVARLAGAPFVAAASPRFAGCDDIAATPDPDDWGNLPADEGWSDLRKSAEAPYLGLACPRVLLRGPLRPRERPDRGLPFCRVPRACGPRVVPMGQPGLRTGDAAGADVR